MTATAKMILTVIIGSMVSWATEELPMGKAEYQKYVLKTCLELAKTGIK